MAALDENALICDLAETYRIYDYRSLPLRMAAIFSAGLREDSRVRQKMRKEPATRDILLLASIVDRLTWIGHGLSGNKEQAPSIVDIIYGVEPKKNENEIVSYESGEAYEAAKRKILGKGGD